MKTKIVPMPSHRKCMKTTENKGFLPPPKTMGQSVAVKSPVAFQKNNKINAFAHVSYGMALTLFNSSWSQSTVESAIKEAYESAKKIETQGDRVRLHGTGSGQKIEMWLNTKSKTIETAYPIK